MKKFVDQQIVDMYMAGKSQYTIMKDLHVGFVRVKKVLSLHPDTRNMLTRNTITTQQEKDKLVKQLLAGDWSGTSKKACEIFIEMLHNEEDVSLPMVKYAMDKIKTDPREIPKGQGKELSDAFTSDKS